MPAVACRPASASSSADNLNETAEIHLSLAQQFDAQGNALARLQSLTSLPFGLLEKSSGRLLRTPLADIAEELPPAVLAALCGVRAQSVFSPAGSRVVYYACELSPGRNGEIAAGWIPRSPTVLPAGARAAARRAGWSPARWQDWLTSLPSGSPQLVESLLQLARRQVASSTVEREADDLAQQLDLAYEELQLLHEVARNLRVSREPSHLAQICLKRLARAIPAEGFTVLLAHGTQWRVLEAGTLPVDARELLPALEPPAGKPRRQPLVWNGTVPLPGAPEGIHSLIAAPLVDGNRLIGWLAACNAQPGVEFGTVEASLLNAVALILASHLQNVALFIEQDELLIGFVRSLVSTLDAKDPYTRGHSERVALLGKRLALALGLSNDEQEAIYLSGLLHDVGKIGVEDAILRKPGRLTEAEAARLRMHPVLGADILAGLKNLQHILPGVRHHHENFDGSGYPDGLAEREIPQMARILAVADAYDAMGSDRPYRVGMPLERIERTLHEGAGRQWDPRVVRAYFAIREEIRCLWETAVAPGA